jgi:hypothetical protein
MRLRTSWLGGCIAPSMLTVVAVMAFSVGTSQARGINATKYYEDTEGNMCVGAEEVGGFLKSCAWGAQKGKENTGAGYKVLEDNATGNRDAGFGYGSLLENESGSYNTGDGYNSCFHDTSGSNNTCTGYSALLRVKTGGYNTATGSEALFFDTSGSENVGVGGGALRELPEGSSNIALGMSAGAAFTGKESNNIDIGNHGVKEDQNIIRIGSEQSKTFVAGIYEKTVGSPSCHVVVSSVNQLGCESSAVAPDIAPTSEQKQEHAQLERQQNEIDKLTSELHELRGELAGR